MISRDDAAVLLQPLAAPTQAAYSAAQARVERSKEATLAGRAQCDRATLALLDGVARWGFLASGLNHGFEPLPSVSRIQGRHPLLHAWTVGDDLHVQLKSDLAGLDVEQLPIPGLTSPRGARDLVVLTWRHGPEDAFGPTFVNVTASGQMWRLPVADLMLMPTAVAPVQVPKAKLSSTKKAVDKDAGSGGA